MRSTGLIPLARLEEEAVPQTTRDRARILLGMSSLGGPAVLAAGYSVNPSTSIT